MKRFVLTLAVALGALCAHVKAAEANLPLPNCTPEALEQAVGAWLRRVAGEGLELLRPASLNGVTGPARISIRVQEAALKRLVIPVEVELRPAAGGTQLLFLNWRRGSAARCAQAGAAPAVPGGLEVTLVARVGGVEITTPGKLLSRSGPSGRARAMNLRSGSVITGTWLDGERILVDGRTSQ